MGSVDPLRGEANALSVPPGEYARKGETQRNRRRLAQAVDHEVQFDNNRKTLPGLDMLRETPVKIGASARTLSTGAAWLSSARALRCSLKWVNERNPYLMLQVS